MCSSTLQSQPPCAAHPLQTWAVSPARRKVILDSCVALHVHAPVRRVGCLSRIHVASLNGGLCPLSRARLVDTNTHSRHT